MRCEGALAPLVWMIPAPTMGEADARARAGRRYLHFFGRVSAEEIAEWAGESTRSGIETFHALEPELMKVTAPAPMPVTFSQAA